MFKKSDITYVFGTNKFPDEKRSDGTVRITGGETFPEKAGGTLDPNRPGAATDIERSSLVIRMNIDVSKSGDLQKTSTDHEIEHGHQWEGNPTGMYNQDIDRTRESWEQGARDYAQHTRDEKPDMSKEEAEKEGATYSIRLGKKKQRRQSKRSSHMKMAYIGCFGCFLHDPIRIITAGGHYDG